MSHCKPLLIPWLRENVNSNKYPGVQWTNQERTEFSIPWKHALRQDSSDADVLIFKAWAEVSGNGRVHGDTSIWKRNFRSALRAKGFQLVSDNKNDNANPHKVFRWPEESSSASKPVGVQASSSGRSQRQGEPDLHEDLGLPTQEECLEGLNIGSETGKPTSSVDLNLQMHLLHVCSNFSCLPGCVETQFRVSVFYRGVKVSEQLVENEAGGRPDLTGPVLDPKSGLHLVSLPSPGFILDQKQAQLTQRILDNLGAGLDVGVLGRVVYGLRRGDVKAFWSFSRFDHSRTPQEISKLEPQPLYLFKDFIQGILDFVSGRDSPPHSLFLCLGEKWPDPDNRPWEKKLITVEVVLTSMELLKNMAVAGGASSLQSVELQMS
uniref:Interferon regulatory factor 3 n=1 Tax=Tetraodon nigroviridis TaxID=99883 RepID=H3DCK5_TETNG